MEAALRSVLAFVWRRPGRLRAGLAAGFRAQGCLGLPRFGASVLPSAEEVQLRQLEWRGKVVYDIGANVGVFSLFFAREVGNDGQVFAFEPIVANFRALWTNLRINRVGNVHAFNLALGARTESKPTYAGGGSGEASFLASCALDPRYCRGETVSVFRLDDVARERDLPPPNFLKIDVEGAELGVLAGATDLLASARPDLWIELHGGGVVEKAGNARLLAHGLFNLGYRIFHVESATEIAPEGAPPGMGHVFCRRREAVQAARASAAS